MNTLERYLAALPRHDAQELAACLAPDVERIGPYRDVYRGRDAYSEFLASTVEALAGYELVVDRIVQHGNTAVVELSETVDDRDGTRLRTQEAVVFDLDDNGLIARIAVYLQSSEKIIPTP
ncbi:MAG: ketosteroid isomerase-like protein [Actinomycetia bacterium]|nr:ketosteroid isomerase-like protein [Actinomycetes bacterium]